MLDALIIGADSTIGSALYRRFHSEGLKLAGTSRRTPQFIRLDLADDPSLWPELPKCRTAYLCAAATKLDACEKDPQTRLINVTHMQQLAGQLLEQGSFVLFLSSNQVFDGRTPYRKTGDATSPMNEYGRQKAEFERWLHVAPNTAVLRLTKVISSPLPLLDKWEGELRKGHTIEAFDDLVFAPIPLAAVLDAMEFIGKDELPGIYHLSGTKDISYYEIARELARRIGADPALVKASSATKAGIAPQFLPKHGTLEVTALSHIAVPPPLEVIFNAIR